MGERRALQVAAMVPARLRTLSSGRLAERLRHVVWSALVAFGMFVVLLVEPVDQFLWLAQTKISEHQPSGDIVFLSSDRLMNDPEMSHRRIELAETLDELDRRGVGRVFIDITFGPSASSEADQRLAKAITDLGARVTLVDKLVPETDGDTTMVATAPAIAGNANRVVSNQTDRNFLGFAWRAQHSYDIGNVTRRAFGSALAGGSQSQSIDFPIDYGFSPEKIPTISLDSLREGSDGSSAKLPDISGKAIVIGHDFRIDGVQQSMPGRNDVPSSYIDIYAAETLKAGRTNFFDGSLAISFIALAICFAIAAGSSRKRRWTGYAGAVILLPIAFVIGAKLGFRVEFSYAIVLLVVFAVFRSRARWQRRVQMINQDTGLPTLRALEARLVRDCVSDGHLIVAKIQNYERVLKTLPSDKKSSYILKLVDRLRATDANLAIYSEGHSLGWHSPSDATEYLVEHLEGLRAIFAAPVEVAGYSIDVGITFGVAPIDGDPQGRVTAALAASEETSEAHQPIVIAKRDTQTDLLWDISLRARIDEAMQAGEIYCVYQPKIRLENEEVAGVEALVRWHDPARGFISPMHFIQQCEKAGRMEHLTAYVLQSACSAGQLLHFRGQKISMSVNISATMLNDMRVVGIVRNVLQATRFDAKYLVLEITETARIADLVNAACILQELRSLGVKISMDDFGMGAANYEAFYELPFDEVKIDRRFVSNIASDAKAKAIVASIAQMGRDARITVVAEGLEDPADIELLKELGCELVQGYAFSRPLSLANLLEYQQLTSTPQAANMV